MAARLIETTLGRAWIYRLIAVQATDPARWLRRFYPRLAASTFNLTRKPVAHRVSDKAGDDPHSRTYQIYLLGLAGSDAA